ncbi:sensor histidine kinase [Paenibacillus baekrokdamisoli]|uniref:histidine kinase n=1 Tax=Paenibacillus baekrokdamisoli TaxID=1712516 RepID=A0A3G9ISX9_9BACL|nr:sensor histidine kinase [Paenibacillus baekrokdamisoli]MBB3067679.1 two-component system sensor histidine kinase YesM [Paenibacillus baekrokdamisoli]BBH19135.1 sensor histidine kinase [Paenibacillus baekrokdamisoli]
MIRMKRRLNLITLILLLMCIIIIPVLIQGYVLGKGAVQQVESLYDKSVSSNMESLSISLDFYVNHIEDYIRTLSQDLELQRLLDRKESSSASGIQAVRDRLNVFTASYRLRVPLNVQIINDQEEVFSSNLMHDTEVVRLKEIVHQFKWMNDRIPYDNSIMYRNVGADFHDLTTGRNALYFTKNIVQGNMALGLLNVQVSDTLFQRLLRKIQLNSSTLAFISQDNGDLLISSEDKNSDLQELTSNAIAHAKINGGEYSSFRIQWNKKSYFCSIQSMPFLKWYLIALTPEDSLASPTKQLWNHTLTVTISSILLISLILYIFTRKAMLPILNLSKTVRKIRFNDTGESQNVIWQFDYKGLEEIEILCSGINQMVSRINEQIEQIKSDEREKSNLELNLLLSQIKPHFLHNSINSIRWMAEMKGEKTIAQTLVNLSSMLNYTLSKSLTIWSTIGEELDYVKSYIAFQEKRMFMKIETQWDVPQEVLHASILKLTLQPIVENAILHGFTNIDGITPKLTILCAVEEDQIQVVVMDNGVGMEESIAAGILLNDINEIEDEERTSGIGMKNVHRRMQLEYGIRYGIDIRSEKGKGTTVTLTFPYRNHIGGISE